MLQLPFKEQQLIETAQSLTFKTQAKLVQVENPLAREFYVNVFPGLVYCSQSLRQQIEQYLLLTSIPFSFTSEYPNLRDLWPLGCNACALASTRIMEERLFFPTGNMHPTCFVVGDAPSHTGGYGDIFDPELDIGRIWVSKPTSITLRMALHAIGLHTRTWYTNLLLRSVRDNDASNGQERMKCGKHVNVEIDLLRPKFVLTLGMHVSQHWNWSIPKVQVPHPAYAVRMHWGYQEYARIIRRAIQVSGFGAYLEGAE